MGMLVKPDVHHWQDKPVGCAGKIAYRSRKKAVEHLRRLHASTPKPGVARDLRGLAVYYCPTHECWHVGHKPGSAHRRAR